ncbi:MAG: tail fiber domain-containing protein [Sphingobacteriaceae bacterium]|nr:tail fiber domain-containing protein [Sphingobacteriaceae bacterium]
MRTKLLLLMLLCLLQYNAQVTTPFNVGIPTDYVGWSAVNPFPVRIQHQGNQPILFATTNFTRMIINNGPGNQNSGRIGMGNDLTGFVPIDRLHLHQIDPNNINNYLRFTNPFTGPSNTDGFRIGNSSVNNPNGPQGDARLEQFETAPILMLAPNSNTNSPNLLPYEWFRLQNGQTFQAAPLPAPTRITDGYIGLNKSNPRSHIEMLTPAFQGGEEFFMAKPSDIFDPPASTITATNVQMGMMNATAVANQFLPCFFGNINQQFQLSPALQMLGAIHNNQDAPSNLPVVRFVAARDWTVNANLPNPLNATLASSVINRPIFSWQNSNTVNMYMSANGRVRIGSNLFMGNPANPAQRPNNRYEITAWAIDPYFNPLGNPVGNPNFGNVTIGGASGLRFTFLTSNDLVQVPNATNQIDPAKVLTTDKNGDVVMINTIANANNGLSVLNGTVQLGANCPATPTQVTAAQLLNNRQIPMNGFNTIWAGATGSVGIGLPINACVPNNRLEVDNNTGPNPLSGLRLTDLAGNPPTLPNTINKVLSVNLAGDVILTPVPTQTTFGNLCTSSLTPSALTGDFEMPLGTFKYRFTGQSQITTNPAIQQDMVSIGYPCGSTLPVAKFSVLESQTVTNVPDNNYAGHFKNTNISPVTSLLNMTGGVFGEARGLIATNVPNSPINAGGVFEGFGSWSNIGVFGRMSPLAFPNNFGPSRYNMGVAGISDLAVNNAAFPNSANYGVYGDARNSPSLNFGVYGEVPASTGTAFSYGVYGVAPSNGIDFAGYFNGDVFTTGSYFPSDQLLKQNFDSIPNALGIINQLKPKTFDYKLTQYPQMNLPSGLQYGLVAQNVQTVMPVIVSSATQPERTIGSTTYPAFTYSTVEYTQLIPVLIRAVQQLSAQNQKLDSLITALTQTVSSCCSNSAAKQTGINGNDPNALSQINVNLSDIDMIVLDQNKPNPFAEQTTITYNVPEKYGFAQLVFKTIDGKIIKTVDITKKGLGQVNVFANDLSNGLYMYSLIVDGKTVDTKKMVKQN